MAHSIETHLTAIKNAADRASGTMRTDAAVKCNREAYRALVADLAGCLERLAYGLDADGSYISDEAVGLTSKGGCVDSVFFDLMDADDAAEPYRAPYSTLNHVQQGIVHGARI